MSIAFNSYAVRPAVRFGHDEESKLTQADLTKTYFRLSGPTQKLVEAGGYDCQRVAKPENRCNGKCPNCRTGLLELITKKIGEGTGPITAEMNETLQNGITQVRNLFNR